MANIFESRHARNATLALVLGGVLALVFGYLLLQPYLSLLYDAEQLRVFIQQFGPLGPLVIIGLQAVQIFIAPLPGPLFMLSAGYLYGPFLGALYGMIGAAIGSAAAIILAKRYGRPFVEWAVEDRGLTGLMIGSINLDSPPSSSYSCCQDSRMMRSVSSAGLPGFAPTSSSRWPQSAGSLACSPWSWQVADWRRITSSGSSLLR